MSAWDTYKRENTTAVAGGDWPEVPDDLYEVTVLDVSEPETKPDPFNQGKDKTDFYITFELPDEVSNAQLRWYVTLTDSYMDDGFVSEKSKLYKTMDALNLPIEGGVDPEAWIGLGCRAMVENKTRDDGSLRPRITDVKPARKAAPKAPEKRQPVGAGGLRGRLGVED